MRAHFVALFDLLPNTKSIDLIKPGLQIVVIVVSTVANMFLTLFQAVLIHVNTLITTSQA